MSGAGLEQQMTHKKAEEMGNNVQNYISVAGVFPSMHWDKPVKWHVEHFNLANVTHNMHHCKAILTKLTVIEPVVRINSDFSDLFMNQSYAILQLQTFSMYVHVCA